MPAKTMNQYKYAYTPDYAVPPGETLAEVIGKIGMSQKELAIRTGLTEQSIIRIIKGDQPITYETAIKLEQVTSVPARFWNNLEMQYREQLAKIEQEKELERGIDWLQSIPSRELKEIGIIDPKNNDKISILREVYKFFGVSSVDAWKQIWKDPKVAARRSACFESDPGAASAWIRLGELASREIECAPYNKDQFEKALNRIRDSVIKDGVDLDKMRNTCAQAGVAVAIVPGIRKAPWNGASKWLTSDKAMILLSTRGKSEDIFWFSFFHEAYHILYGKKQRLYIATDNNKDPEEQKADRFAAERLIPERYNNRIRAIRTKNEVRALADELAVSPGIVAGRFRYLTRKWNYFKDLTRSL
ncbi:MAG: HigA family addiction module antitoxin [Candidatus Sumerlaeia bacterium]